jgi:hypothetical protein
MDLPMWNKTTFGTMFLTLNVPFYRLNLALFVGGFFFLPWQTVLIVAAAVFVAGIPTSTFLYWEDIGTVRASSSRVCDPAQPRLGSR